MCVICVLWNKQKLTKTEWKDAFSEVLNTTPNDELDTEHAFEVYKKISELKDEDEDSMGEE